MNDVPDTAAVDLVPLKTPICGSGGDQLATTVDRDGDLLTVAAVGLKAGQEQVTNNNDGTGVCSDPD